MTSIRRCNYCWFRLHRICCFSPISLEDSNYSWFQLSARNWIGQHQTQPELGSGGHWKPAEGKKNSNCWITQLTWSAFHFSTNLSSLQPENQLWLDHTRQQFTLPDRNKQSEVIPIIVELNLYVVSLGTLMGRRNSSCQGTRWIKHHLIGWSISW